MQIVRGGINYETFFSVVLLKGYNAMQCDAIRRDMMRRDATRRSGRTDERDRAT